MATGDPRPPSQAEWAAALPLNAPRPSPGHSRRLPLRCTAEPGNRMAFALCLRSVLGRPRVKGKKGSRITHSANSKNTSIKFPKTAFADQSPDPQILFKSPSRFLHLTRHPTLTFRPSVFPLQGYIFVTGNANFFPFPMRASVKVFGLGLILGWDPNSAGGWAGGRARRDDGDGNN